MANLVPIGIENFVDAQRIYYVDKTVIVKDLLGGCASKAVLVTRPSCFIVARGPFTFMQWSSIGQITSAKWKKSIPQPEFEQEGI